MITAAQLNKFTNLTADQLTDIMVDGGYDITDESFITITFKGMNTGSSFVYEGMYLDTHGEGGFQYATVVVSYDTATEETSVDYHVCRL